MSHRPRKRFGQHFLHDRGVVDRIVAAVAPQADDTLVEIGPGEGILTGPLLAAAGRLHAVEVDRDLAAALRDRPDWAGRLTLHEGDALHFDFAALAGSGRLRDIRQAALRRGLDPDRGGRLNPRRPRGRRPTAGFR